MTELPLWAVYAVTFGTPASALLGVLISHVLTHRANTQLEDRSKREETLRMLRWAAELAVSGDNAKANLGVKQLASLGASELLDDDEQVFVDAALEAAQTPGKLALDVAGQDAQPVLLLDSAMIDAVEADQEVRRDQAGGRPERPGRSGQGSSGA